ncbi:protein of unknown function [Natronincola peptidivorans]|uniref:DUF1850 domain-containing protein n=2 Tax=Natronincola peptidivorans TaxID=426128 RepID=A0A1I0A4K9_9FIRM|nr:protein of unknown function [Natronincola peptidivorans]
MRLFIIIIGILLFCIYFLVNRSQKHWLIIMDEASQEKYYQVEVQPGDEVEFYWIHSVEHISWIELFTIDDSYEFLLQEIRFEGFGAGIPHDRGKEVKVEDGYIIMTDIEEKYPAYDWINSHTATEKITFNGEKIASGKDLPHHGYMKMVIQER